MPASKNSKNSRTSKPKKKSAPRSGRGASGHEHYSPGAALAVLCGAALSSAIAIWWCFAHGYILYYGDAQAHLAIARRMIDSRTPGFEQIGTVWLPLPHLLMLPFVRFDSLWRTGLAGAIPSGLCFVAATGFLFGAVRRTFHSTTAGVTAAMIFALNPNMLYLQSIPMSESPFLACFTGLIYFLVRFHTNHRPIWAALAGLMAMGGTMCRYDGWFLLPFIALYFLIFGGHERWPALSLFTIIAAIGPLFWFGHNLYYNGNALEFYNGPYSAKAIQGGKPYPGQHDWLTAIRFYADAAKLNTGWPLAILGLIGAVVSFARRKWLGLSLLLIPITFYLLGIHSTGNPVWTPALYFDSYYNTRYGLAFLPFCAFAASSMVAGRSRRTIATVVIILSSIPWIAYPKAESWITWKESQVNSRHRRALETEAAEYMKIHYKPGDGLLMPFSDVVGIAREAAIPLRDTIHEGNGVLLYAAMARPALFPFGKWAIGIAGDTVSSRVGAWSRRGLYWDCVKIVEVKGAPPIEIYRRRITSQIHR